MARTIGLTFPSAAAVVTPAPVQVPASAPAAVTPAPGSAKGRKKAVKTKQ